MFARSILAVFAGLAALASAQSGNPIYTPSLNEEVPAGKPFEITWGPTPPTTNTITLVLLKGPSTNAVPIATIVAGIPNSGSYSWTPSTDLEPSAVTGFGYGIKLLVDGTSDFQYSTQFGISNPAYVSGASSIVASTSASVYASSVSKTVVISAASTPCETSTASPETVSSHSANSTIIYPTGTAYSTHVASTGAPQHNTSVIQPSKPLTVPTSLLTTATAVVAGTSASASASTPAAHTGAASHVKAGLGLAGAIAGLVMAL